MKKFLILAMVMAAGSAQAAHEINCKGNSGYGTSETMTMSLKSVGQDVNQVDEGTKVVYTLLLKNNDDVLFAANVKAAEQDVLFQFQSKSKKYGKIAGTVYMDELDQSSISLNGQDFVMDCGQ